jgi:hypothetical protein
LTGKTGKWFGSVPRERDQSGAETRLDFVDHLDHLPETTLCLVRADAVLALDRIPSKPSRPGNFLACCMKSVRNLAGSKKAFVRILG